MMKFYKSSLTLACLSLMMMSCDSDKDDATMPKEEEVHYTTVDANTTDLKVKDGIDRSVDGIFIYTENHYMTPKPHQFTSDKKYIWAHYSGQDRRSPVLPVEGSKINGNAMCMNGEDGCYDKRPSTVWNLTAMKGQNRELKWEYLMNGKGYRVEMTDLPEPADWESVPDRISQNENLSFQFKRNSAADSIIVSILFIPKDKINKVQPLGAIGGTHAWMFPVSPQNTSYTITKEKLQNYIAHTGRPANDSVFINLITERHVIKVIDNKKMLVTYAINDIRPVIFEKSSN